MKIYFAGSITGGRDDHSLYADIIRHLSTKGTVLTEHIGNHDLSSNGEVHSAQFIHERDMKWLLEADVVVAETTTPSLGVGYEIGRAIENGKPVLCLHRPAVRKLSNMILGCSRVSTRAYENLSQAKVAIDEYFSNFTKKSVQTLVFVHQGERLLLGMKKRGFGKDRWNGFGGKVQPSETIEHCARRELEEEAGIGTVTLQRVGLINFHFSGDTIPIEGHIFVTKKFTGIPHETEEMRPQWFNINDIPYDQMWPDDKFWLPLLLEEKPFEAEFWFDKDGKIEKHELKTI